MPVVVTNLDEKEVEEIVFQAEKGFAWRFLRSH